MAYIGPSIETGFRKRYVYTATAGQTSFSGNDSVGISLSYTDSEYLDVYQNGVLLVPGSDYTATTGTTVVLVTGASADDKVEMVAYQAFGVADTVSRADGGAFGGNISTPIVTATTSVKTPLIEFTDGDDAITIADGGGVTLSSTLTGTTAAFSTADNEAQLTLTSTDADANVGPLLKLHRDSSSPADGDNLGRITFVGENDASEEVVYGRINGKANDITDGTEDGEILMTTLIGGTNRSRMHMTPSVTVFNEDSVDVDFRVESNALSAALMVDAGNDRVGFGLSTPSRPFEFFGDDAGNYIAEFEHDGNNSNRYGLIIRVGADDASGTNYAITFRDGDNSTQGSITFTSGTVTYGAFTAHHPCILPNSDNANGYPYGTLLETTSISYTQKNGVNTERGILYNVQKTQSANSKAVLGAYGSSMNGGPDEETNMHQALVLGDGHILCNNAGGNIEVGDGICSSATAGIGQKATVNPSMIIGIAQEAVTFSGSETKLVPVQYGLQQFIPWS